MFLTEYTKDSTTDQTVHIIKSETVYTVHIVATNSTYVIYIQYMYNNTRRHRGLNLSLGTNPDNDTYVANTSPKHESIVKPYEKTQNSSVPYLRWMLGPLKPGSSGLPPGLVGAYPSHSAVLERSFPELFHAAATQTI